MEARELAKELEDVILEFQKKRPRTSDADVRQAVSIVRARRGIGGARQRTAVLLIAVLTGLIVALTMGFLLLRMGG
jgi:hypothetical protein